MSTSLPPAARQLPAAMRIATVGSNKTFSVLHRPTPIYKAHVPLTNIERGTMAVGSAVMSLFNPRRGGELLVYHFRFRPLNPDVQI